MSTRNLIITTGLVVSFFAVPISRAQDAADDQIKKQIVEECLAIYLQSRPCPCPFSRGCWVSAWLVPGGAKPLCYNDDISAEQIAQYRSGDKTFIASRCTARH